MTDVEPMAVVDPVDDLLEVPQRLGRGQTTARDEIVKQLPALDVLQDQEPARSCTDIRVSLLSSSRALLPYKDQRLDLQLLVRLPDIVQAHHVWVVDELHDDDLSLDTE
jgi:hypothetical protein